MRLRIDDMADDEAGEILGAVLDQFDFETEHHQAAHDFIERRVGLEMRFEPAERRLHRVPDTSEGCSSGRKP